MSAGIAPITGERHSFSLRSPLEALASFYLAFNTRDLALMESVWLGGEEPSMDNPIGGIRRGWEEIRLGYQKLFSGPAQVHVEFYDYCVHEDGSAAVFVGRERGWWFPAKAMLECSASDRGRAFDRIRRLTTWFCTRGSCTRISLSSDCQEEAARWTWCPDRAPRHNFQLARY